MKKIYTLTEKELNFLNEYFSENVITLEKFNDVCRDMVEDLTGTIDVKELESLYFWERVLEDTTSIETIKLKDKDDKDCFRYLSDLVDEITGEDNYFSEHDRDQDLWSYFEGVEIYKFELDSNNTLIVRINITLEELKEEVKNQYTMKILFKDCWLGHYVGGGNYEGGDVPDVLITNVPNDITDSELFNYYVMSLCDGYCNHDVLDYESEVVQGQLKTKPIKINSLDELEKNSDKVFIEIDYNDLIDWIDKYLD